MEIYLMQHGACLSKEIDPDQPLSPVGRDQVQKSALAMKRLGIQPDLVVSSPKTRAAQTAELVAEALGVAERNRIQDEVFKAMAPPESSVAFLRSLSGTARVFVAGHLPNLAEVAGRLLSPCGKVGIAIENGALLRLDTDTQPKGETLLRFYLQAKHLFLCAQDT